jgi:hypothetical protein
LKYCNQNCFAAALVSQYLPLSVCMYCMYVLYVCTVCTYVPTVCMSVGFKRSLASGWAVRAISMGGAAAAAAAAQMGF